MLPHFVTSFPVTRERLFLNGTIVDGWLTSNGLRQKEAKKSSNMKICNDSWWLLLQKRGRMFIHRIE